MHFKKIAQLAAFGISGLLAAQLFRLNPLPLRPPRPWPK